MNSRKLSIIWGLTTGGSIIGITTAFVIHTLSNVRLRNTIIDQAKKYLGIKEVLGQNQNFTDITFSYKLQHLGWRPGDEWCSYFVKLVLLEAFSSLKLYEHYHIVKKYFSGSTQQTWNNFKSLDSYIIQLTDKPNKGAIAIWRNVQNPGFGHTGIVIDTYREKFLTIEGNLNNSVAQKWRTVREYTSPQGRLQLLGFIKFKV